MSRPPFSARIISHSHGQGAVSLDEIEDRARELAKIDGRPAGEYTDLDLAQARREMSGGHLEEEAGEAAYVIGPDLVAGSTGHHVPNLSSDESEHAVEELVLEGLEEAEHDQMLAASEMMDEDAADLDG